MRSPTLMPFPSNSPTISIPPHLSRKGVLNIAPKNTPAFVLAGSDVVASVSGTSTVSIAPKPPVPKPIKVLIL